MSHRPPPLPPPLRKRSSGGAAAPEELGAEESVPEVLPVEEEEREAAGQEAPEEEGPLADAVPPGMFALLRGLGSCVFSLVVHLAVMLLMAYVAAPLVRPRPVPLVTTVVRTLVEDEPVEVELEANPTLVTEPTWSWQAAGPQVGVDVGSGGTLGPPQLDAKLVQATGQDAAPDEIAVEYPLASAPSFDKLVAAIPDGEIRGDPRAVIDNYQEAMDRIAQELMWMMDKGPVLVIWLFDQSGSMKDDQREIRDRFGHVYRQLGLLGRDRSQYLATSIVSYGAAYRLHTSRPTSDLAEIWQAIEEVPEDPSGLERMCQAVGQAILQHRDWARTSRRQMALILVTDESGEEEENLQLLERTIAEAKAARCRVYVLGRESVFGYPYAHIRWVHPQTQHVHWIRVNRGPETGFVEELQTDGFRRRHDAFPSGFGPYEQCRLVQETGGVFFMLPGLESDLVRGEKRHYELELMRPYRPDLRARAEVLADRARYPLRTTIWNVVWDLNPYREEVAPLIEMRVHFAPQYDEFVRQTRIEQAKVRNYLPYLARVQKVLEGGQRYRDQEAAPRWQANYDLIYAQVVAYQARLWEYAAALEQFVQHPPVVPLTKPPNLHLVHWDVVVRNKTLTSESRPYIERATELFQLVGENHPGTPWAARAGGELKNGFGVELQPEYWRDLPQVSGPLIPVPKL